MREARGCAEGRPPGRSHLGRARARRPPHRHAGAQALARLVAALRPRPGDGDARGVEDFRPCLDLSPSLPGLTRQSIFFAKPFLRRKMDPRVKPAGDTCGYALNQTSRKML